MLMNYIDLSYFYRLYDTYFMVWRIYHLLRKHKLTITDITENMIETLLIGANIRCHRKKLSFISKIIHAVALPLVLIGLLDHPSFYQLKKIVYG